MDAAVTEFYELHAHICKGLADPKRLLLINALRNGERTVSELVAELGLPQANVSQHLAILRSKGMVKARRAGQNVFYELTTQKIVAAVDLLREVMAEHYVAPGD